VVKKRRAKLSTAKRENLPLPYGVSREDLDKVDVDKLREAMVKGVYLTELLLFSQAEHEAARLQHTREVSDVLFGSLYDQERMSKSAAEGGYTLDHKIELLKLADDMNHRRLKFLGDLHRNVASGMEAVNSVQKAADAAKVPADAKPSKKRAVKEARRALEDAMAERVRELEAKPVKGR
jgi:hypothetical protein